MQEYDIFLFSYMEKNIGVIRNENVSFVDLTSVNIVSFAAVIRVVTQCSSPTNGCSLEPCFLFLKLTNKEQASISWKPGPLAANVTRNMIGAAANKGKGMQSR